MSTSPHVPDNGLTAAAMRAMQEDPELAQEYAERAYRDLDAQVDEAINRNDLVAVYRSLVPLIAQRPSDEITIFSIKLQHHFGRDLRPADFKRQIKAAQIAHKRLQQRKRTRNPMIIVNTKFVRESTEQALPALRAANVPPTLFERRGEMVEVHIDREDGRPSVRVLNEHDVRSRLDRCADFMRATEDGEKPIPVPMELVRDVMSMRSEWRLPVLNSVVEAPTLRPDGSILDTPGYDEQSRLFYAPADGMTTLPVPERPMIDDVQAAWDLINEAVGEFPYVDDTARANLYGLLLTPIIRPALGGGNTPLALIDAPKAGTGKSLLFDLVSIISTGRPGAMSPFPRNDEEMQKQIGSKLLAGRPLVCFDNLEGSLSSPSLCLVLTAQEYEARILGFSKDMAVPNNATWIVTGNNIQPSGDMPRRCYHIRLDAQMSNPALGRTFKHADVKAWAKENRGHLVHALLTIARYWYADGCPNYVAKPLGSFEAWHKTIGSILAHAGASGFLANMEAFISNVDETANEWEVFLLHIASIWSEGRDFTVADLVAHIGNSNEFRSILPEKIAEAYSKNPETAKLKLGLAFRKRRDAPLGEHQVQVKRSESDSDKKVARWQVVMKRS